MVSVKEISGIDQSIDTICHLKTKRIKSYHKLLACFLIMSSIHIETKWVCEPPYFIGSFGKKMWGRVAYEVAELYI